jgi:hypothetical protein
MFNECYTLLNNMLEFWPEMWQLSKLMEREVQMVYLIITLPSHVKLKFINIMRININDIHMFQVLINWLNIVYSIIKYVKGEFKRGDIITVYKLME